MRKNWTNLVYGKCPHCSYRLEQEPKYHPLYPNVMAEAYVCPNTFDCPGFRIGANRMREIVNGIKANSFGRAFV